MTLATVASGNSIWGPPDPTAAASFSPFLFQAPPTIANPGDTLDLPDDEIARLITLGGLVDPSKRLVEIDHTDAYQLIGS